jgi:hypothetical protein
MYQSGPIGSAACVRALATIRVAGERFTRGCLRHLTKRVAEPIGFFALRALGCQGRPARGAALYSVRAEGTRYEYLR